MDKRTEQLLAWYVNGTLVGAERNRVDDALAGDEAALRLLRWETTVRAAIKNDPVYNIAADRGLAQVLQRMRSDGAPETPAKSAQRRVVTTGAAVDERTVVQRVREWLNFSPALAVAFTLIAVQFGVIGQMWSTRDDEIQYAESRALANAARNDAYIRVLFKPTTTEAQMSAMLRANNAEIVAGPSQLGDYYLLVKPSDAAQTLARLLPNPQVDSAEIVNALPAKN